jgi:hypothetical protein
MTMMLWRAGQTHTAIARLAGLFVAHAGGGFVHQEKLRVLRDQHANFQPLFLPVTQRAGLPSARSVKPTVLSTSPMRSRCAGVVR